MAAMGSYQRKEVLEHCVREFERRFKDLALSLCIEAGKPIKVGAPLSVGASSLWRLVNRCRGPGASCHAPGQHLSHRPFVVCCYACPAWLLSQGARMVCASVMAW